MNQYKLTIFCQEVMEHFFTCKHCSQPWPPNYCGEEVMSQLGGFKPGKAHTCLAKTQRAPHLFLEPPPNPLW